MSPQDYSDLVKRERAALAKLQARVKAWGATVTLEGVRWAWDDWSKLAAEVEQAKFTVEVPF